MCGTPNQSAKDLVVKPVCGKTEKFDQPRVDLEATNAPINSEPDELGLLLPTADDAIMPQQATGSSTWFCLRCPKVTANFVSFRNLLLEERTIMLILTPLVATMVTGTLTAIDYHTNPTPWKYLFVSQALNSIKPEPWLFFVTRYVLWHTVIINMLVFKCRHLPRRLWLLPIVTAGTNLCIIWAACRQLGNNNQRMHNRFANIYGTICVVESILLWWPNLGVVALYALVLVAGVYPKYYPFDTGIPLIYDKPDLLSEWAIILIHFVVVWHRAPKVDKELADGTYASWNWRRPFESLCMCLCCCPGVRVERNQYAQLP